MMVLLIGRSAAAVAGVLLVLAAWASVIRTLVVPRRAGTWVTRWVHPIVIAIDAVPALWSGPRRSRAPAIPPIRPALGPPPRTARSAAAVGHRSVTTAM